MDVLRRLSDDDDENPDIFYLLGLALGIVAEAEEEEEEALLIEAREALETCLRVRSSALAFVTAGLTMRTDPSTLAR